MSLDPKPPVLNGVELQSGQYTQNFNDVENSPYWVVDSISGRIQLSELSKPNSKLFCSHENGFGWSEMVELTNANKAGKCYVSSNNQIF